MYCFPRPVRGGGGTACQETACFQQKSHLLLSRSFLLSLPYLPLKPLYIVSPLFLSSFLPYFLFISPSLDPHPLLSPVSALPSPYLTLHFSLFPPPPSSPSFPFALPVSPSIPFSCLPSIPPPPPLLLSPPSPLPTRLISPPPFLFSPCPSISCSCSHPLDSKALSKHSCSAHGVLQTETGCTVDTSRGADSCDRQTGAENRHCYSERVGVL